MARFYPFVGFVVLTISTFFLVSCQWNENTAKRYDVAMKTACSVIDSMTPEKIKAECSNLPEGTQRDNCVSAKNAALDCLRAAKVKAAFAYVYCDKDGLKKAVEKAEKAAKLIQGVWSVVKPLLGDAGGGDTTNINIAASGTLSGGTYNMTILSGSGSTVAVNWGNNSFGQPVIDTFSVTGTASYTITAIGGGNYQVNVSQLRLTLTCSCFNDGTTISITEPAGGFSLVASPNSQVFAGGYKGTYEGPIVGALSGTDSSLDFKIKLDFYFSSNFLQMLITTLGPLPGDQIFTAPPAGTERYWDFYLSDQLAEGGITESIVLKHAAPNKSFEIYMAPTLGPATQTFNGAGWDLKISSQVLVSSGLTDQDGSATVSYQPEAGSAGSKRFFQAIVYLNPGTKSTAVVGTEIGHEFRRGDANDDGVVNIADVSTINEYLFNGGSPPNCFDAADSDDSGELDITDSVYLNQWLFNGGAAPPEPGPFACGVDRTPDAPQSDDYQLGCLHSNACP